MKPLVKTSNKILWFTVTQWWSHSYSPCYSPCYFPMLIRMSSHSSLLSFLNSEPLLQLWLTVFQFSIWIAHQLLSLLATRAFGFCLSKVFPNLYFYFCSFSPSPSSSLLLLRLCAFPFSHFQFSIINHWWDHSIHWLKLRSYHTASK